MPRGDGTGPMGSGPMTGRAAGYCAGFGVPGFANPGGGAGRGFGRGFGFGRGRGMGFGRGFGWGMGLGRGWGFQGAPYAPYAAAPSRDQELDALKNQAAQLQDTLDAIRTRMDTLQAEPKAE
jgi:hypothetical protein